MPPYATLTDIYTNFLHGYSRASPAVLGRDMCPLESTIALPRPVTRRVRAPPVRKLRQHALSRREERRAHAIVPLDIAPCDRLRDSPVGQRVVIAQHLPRASSRIRSLLQLGSRTSGACRVSQRVFCRMVKPPRAVDAMEWVLPIEARSK